MKRKSNLLIMAIPAIIILLGGVIYEYGISSLREEISSLRDIEASKIKTLSKYLDAIAQKPNLEKQILTLKETLKNDDSKIFVAQTPSIAAANLQNSIKGIITGRGGSINSERVEKPAETGKYKIVNVALDVVFPDIRALADTLFALETQTPYIVIRELDVRIRNYTDPRDLIVKMQIAALTHGQ